MNLTRRIRRAATGLKARSASVHDDNFIGFDKYARHGAYHWAQLETNAEYRQKIDLVIEEVKPTDVCLDLGCGDGAYVSRVAAACRRIFGIDADFAAVDWANRELGQAGIGNAECLQLPISSLTLEVFELEEPFDVVYSMDVIEHLPQPEQLVETAQRLVRPGGTVIIGTPLYITDDLVSPYHVREFRREEIAAIIDSTLTLDRELILPARRLDGETHDDGFYVGFARA